MIFENRLYLGILRYIENYVRLKKRKKTKTIVSISQTVQRNAYYDPEIPLHRPVVISYKFSSIK